MKPLIDAQLLERIHRLPPDKQAEVVDFVDFLVGKSGLESLAGGLPPIDDLVGALGWPGDAVASQRMMRDEWQ